MASRTTNQHELLANQPQAFIDSRDVTGTIGQLCVNIMYPGVTGDPPRNRGPASVKVWSRTKHRNYSVRSIGFGKSPRQGVRFVDGERREDLLISAPVIRAAGKYPQRSPRNTALGKKMLHVGKAFSSVIFASEIEPQAFGYLRALRRPFVNWLKKSKPNLFNIRAFLRVSSVPYGKLSATPFISIKTQKRTLLFVGELHRYPHKTADLTSFS